MITEIRWCEDCSQEVVVWGHTEYGNPDLVMEEAPEHEGHDIS